MTTKCETRLETGQGDHHMWKQVFLNEFSFHKYPSPVSGFSHVENGSGRKDYGLEEQFNVFTNTEQQLPDQKKKKKGLFGLRS